MYDGRTVYIIMESIPIQDLTPDQAPPSYRAINAVVTLLWPYSSSTRQCALLLADPDFRLRSKKGQVRVRFTGASAAAVAKAHVGIGDEVRLELDGASWASDGGAVQTPGRSVDGELVFAGTLALRIVRDGAVTEVSVDEVTPPRSPQWTEEAATPLPKTVSNLRSSLDGALDGIPIYSSPAFVKRLRLSGESLFDAPYNPFADPDVDAQQPRKKQRMSFGAVPSWRYTERTPSPENEAFGDTEREIEEATMLNGDEELLSAAQDAQQQPIATHGASAQPRSPASPPQGETLQELLQSVEMPPDSGSERVTEDIDETARVNPVHPFEPAQPPAVAMPPPPLPRLQMPSSSPTPEDVANHDLDADQQGGPLTPRLQPISSAALPLPSPFPTDAAQQPFPALRREPVAEPREDASSSPIRVEPAGAGRTRAGEVPDTYADETLLSSSPNRASNEHSKPPILDVQDDDEEDLYSSDRPLPIQLAVDSTATEEPAAAHEDRLVKPDHIDLEGSVAQPIDEFEEIMDDSVEVIHEDDAEEVLDADKLEGEEPSDDDTGDEYNEGFTQNGTSVVDEELPQEFSESEQSEEDEDGLPALPQQTTEVLALQREQTPVKARQNQSTSDFGLDGAVAIPTPPVRFGFDHVITSFPPASQQTTPQSTKDRVMKRTYQSLFGFQKSPSPTKTHAQKIASPTLPSPQLESRSPVRAAETAAETVDVADELFPEEALLEAANHDDVKVEPGHYEQPSSSQQRPSPIRHSAATVIDLASSSDVDEEETRELDANVLPQTPDDTSGDKVKGPDIAHSCNQQEGIHDAVLIDQRVHEVRTEPQNGQSAEASVQEDVFIRSVSREPESIRAVSEDAEMADLPGSSETPEQQALPIETQPLSSPHSSSLVDPRLELEVADLEDAQTAETLGSRQTPEQQALPIETQPLSSPPSVLIDPRLELEHADMEDSQRSEGTPQLTSAVSSFQQLSSSPNSVHDDDERSSAIEQLDLSQAEPADWTQLSQASQSQGLTSQAQRLAPPSVVVADSVDSPQTTIVAESSRPGSKDGELSGAETPRAKLPIEGRVKLLREEHAIMPSQELGSLSGIPTIVSQGEEQEMKAWTASNEPGEVLSLQERQSPPRSTARTIVVDLDSSSPVEQDQPYDDNLSQDDKLLAEFVEDEHITDVGEVSRDDGEAVTPTATAEQTTDLHDEHGELSAKDHAHSFEAASPLTRDDKGTFEEESESARFETQLTFVESERRSHPDADTAGESAQFDTQLPHAESERPSHPDADVAGESAQFDTQVPFVESERVLCPPLPMSPSLSQSQPSQLHEPIPLQRPSEKMSSVLPPTPQLTQVESSNQVLEQMTDEAGGPPQAKTSARRSLKTRLSNVPDVISAWFTPKRSSGVVVEAAIEEGAENVQDNEDVDTTPSRRRHQSNGVMTSMGYYTPLASLDRQRNPSSQQVYGNNTVDVFAVVCDQSSAPKKSKLGPRDFFTIFKIADTSLSAADSIKVEVFRPWKAFLPVTEVGDVVLLRSFTVKSRSGGPYLLSTDASAWCVWRFAEHQVAQSNEQKPAWARRRAGSDADNVREEVKGPPIEYGEQERNQAHQLRSWWLDHGQVNVDAASTSDAVLNGHAVQPLTAKL